MLMDELKDFPNATHDDLSDAVSAGFYDLDMIPAPKKEVEDVAGTQRQPRVLTQRNRNMAIRGGAKGNTPDAEVTSTPIDDNHQGLDVVAQLRGADGKTASRTNPIAMDAAGLELLNSINDRLGALLILLAPSYSPRDDHNVADCRRAAVAHLLTSTRKVRYMDTSFKVGPQKNADGSVADRPRMAAPASRSWPTVTAAIVEAVRQRQGLSPRTTSPPRRSRLPSRPPIPACACRTRPGNATRTWLSLLAVAVRRVGGGSRGRQPAPDRRLVGRRHRDPHHATGSAWASQNAMLNGGYQNSVRRRSTRPRPFVTPWLPHRRCAPASPPAPWVARHGWRWSTWAAWCIDAARRLGSRSAR
jgi:hypothetical protein